MQTKKIQALVTKYANQESKMIKPKQHERTDLLCIHEMLSHLHSKCRNISNNYANILS